MGVFSLHNYTYTPLFLLPDEQGGHAAGRRRLHPGAEEARRRGRRRRGSRQRTAGSSNLSLIIFRFRKFGHQSQSQSDKITTNVRGYITSESRNANLRFIMNRKSDSKYESHFSFLPKRGKVISS